MKINKSLEDARVLVKCENETTENKEKEQKIKKRKKGELLGMPADNLGASVLGIMLADKDVIRTDGKTIREKEKIVIPSHPLYNLDVPLQY